MFAGRRSTTMRRGNERKATSTDAQKTSFLVADILNRPSQLANFMKIFVDIVAVDWNASIRKTN